jgi:hypothetical protein
MVESDVRLLNPAPYALPGDILALFEIVPDLSNLGMFRQSPFMTTPAGPDIRNGSDGATRNSDMTVHALQLYFLDVNIVRERDGLNGFGSMTEEVRDGLGNRRMCGREYLGFGRCRGLPSQGLLTNGPRCNDQGDRGENSQFPLVGLDD